MRLLLDTHIFLWSVLGSARLPKRAKAAIQDAEEVFVSAASLWEIAIKRRLGRLDGDPQELLRAIPESGFLELPITGRHAVQVEQLPSHHNDPFARILIAQAMVEPLRLVTSDAKLSLYTDLVLHF